MNKSTESDQVHLGARKEIAGRDICKIVDMVEVLEEWRVTNVVSLFKSLSICILSPFFTYFLLSTTLENSLIDLLITSSFCNIAAPLHAFNLNSQTVANLP